MRITILAFLLLFVVYVNGQTKKASLANTTWIISYRLCSDKNNLGSETVKLLPDGKVKNFRDGSWVSSEHGHWWLIGKRLQMDYSDGLLIRGFDVVLKGNVATGKGFSQLGKTFCVRMTKR